MNLSEMRAPLTTGRGLVETQLVHKEKNEDVFLKDHRPILPTSATSSRSKIEALPNGTKLSLIQVYDIEYSDNDDSAMLLFNGLKKNIPAVAVLAAREAIQPLIDEHYTLVNETYVFNKTNIISEQEYDMLMKSIGLSPPSEYERHQAAVALISLGVEVTCQELLFTVHNNISHSYFYAKKHEHVPGIMLMEIARQAFYSFFLLVGRLQTRKRKLIYS